MKTTIRGAALVTTMLVGLAAGCGGEIASATAGSGPNGAGGSAGGGDADATGDAAAGGSGGGSVAPSSVDCGDAARLDVAGVDGTAVGLTVDDASIYALVRQRGPGGDTWLLTRAPKCGGAPVTLARGDGAPAALALTSGDVVLTTFESGSAAIVVRRVPKAGGDVARIYDTLYGPDVPSDLAVDGAYAWFTNPDFEGVERVALDGTSEHEYRIEGAAYVAAGGGALFAVDTGAVTRLDVATGTTISSGQLLATDVRFARLVGGRVFVGGEYVWELDASDLHALGGSPRTAGWGGAMLGMAADAAGVWVTAETTRGGAVELVSLPAGTRDAQVVATSTDVGLTKDPVALDERAAYWITGGRIERRRR